MPAASVRDEAKWAHPCGFGLVGQSLDGLGGVRLVWRGAQPEVIRAI